MSAKLETEEKELVTEEKPKTEAEEPASEDKNAESVKPETEQKPEPAKKKKKKTKKQRLISSIISFFVKLLVLALVVYLALTFVIGVFMEHTNDMYPSLRDGDLVITLRLERPDYGSVVSYRVGADRRFARVVAMGGDVVMIDESGTFTVNDMVRTDTIYYETLPEGGKLNYPYTVPEGCYFLLNDMRESKKDSRTFGAISEDMIDGSVVLSLRRRGF